MAVFESVVGEGRMPECPAHRIDGGGSGLEEVHQKFQAGSGYRIGASEHT